MKKFILEQNKASCDQLQEFANSVRRHRKMWLFGFLSFVAFVALNAK